MVSYERVLISDLSRYSPTGPWDERELRRQPTYDQKTRTVEVTRQHARRIMLRKAAVTWPPAIARASEQMRRFGETARQLTDKLRKQGYHVG